MRIYYMKKESASLKYALVKSSRKTISITVHPDGRVLVRAPKRASNSQVQAVLNDRMEWILKHKKEFDEKRRLNPKREFVNGEKHLYLGEEYILRVNSVAENSVTANSVSKNCEFIDIKCADASMIEMLMKEWYFEGAKELLPQIAKPLIERFKDSYNISPNKITVKQMKSRWGSCTSKGSISLNSKLIQTPVCCIEYVILHELCHLIHFNHSKNFYSLLTEVIPDWKERKKELRAILH